ncbi:techylectin-5B-like isoform X2 [Argiope bruennichi]|uniref:techylectin-5B-like isoform X2 n=1 Tax=Argiope bruennichi TaxID=94029 RepID=UPI00249464FF|nr:techylectin-5B-like isoform X2 [Argiope bruennichi]
MTGRRNFFVCGVVLLVLVLGISKGEESDENNVIDKLSKPKDCSEHYANGNYESGVYQIYPNSKSINVFCDMNTDGGGWTVIQRRGNFTPLENFYRNWNDYKQGFGSIERDFWLGNENIHVLSTQVPVEIRFELEDVRGERRFAKYKSFHIDDESQNYTLHISGYSGDAGDGMKYHDGQEFSAKDRGNYRAAVALKGSWWIFEWAYVHLNGFYDPGMDDFQAIHWYKWLENEGLAFCEMKIRKRSEE